MGAQFLSRFHLGGWHFLPKGGFKMYLGSYFCTKKEGVIKFITVTWGRKFIVNGYGAYKQCLVN